MNHAHHIAAALLLALLVIIAGASPFLNPRTVSAVSPGVPITGYAWSDNIGWISLNDGSSYGLVVAPNGTISGYAWSDSIGWVSANESGCPSTPCTAKITSTQISGWLKALAGGSAQSGGWDGWISLSGSDPNYGVTKNPDGTFTGYAWGSLVVGWVDFRYAKTVYSVCTPSTAYTCSPTSGWDSDDKSTIFKTDTDAYCAKTKTLHDVCIKTKFCSKGSPTCLESAPTINRHLEAIPLLVQKGGTTKLSWDVSNIKRCSISGSNGDSWSGASAGCAGTSCTADGKTSGAINQRIVYTMTCTKMDNTTFTETATVSVLPVFQER